MCCNDVRQITPVLFLCYNMPVNSLGNISGQGKNREVIRAEIDYTAVSAFQWMQVAEKLVEIVDESFHLLENSLKKLCSTPVYLFCLETHNAAHHIERVLHSFCFLADLQKMYSGKFWARDEHEKCHNAYDKDNPNHKCQIDYVGSSARVCHFISHFFATFKLFSQLELIKFSNIEQVSRIASAFTVVGFGISIISLISREREESFKRDLIIDVSGCLFEMSPNKIVRSIAGIVHATTVYKCLWSNRLVITTFFKL